MQFPVLADKFAGFADVAYLCEATMLNMMQPTLYIIAGCNGAGKTTASMTFLPNLVNCREFVNADEIANGLNPLAPEQMAVAAGRLMLMRIRQLIDENITFAIETTLSTRSYRQLVNVAQGRGYKVVLLFIYLSTVEQAVERVKCRVESGGHDIPLPVIIRRYWSGLANFRDIYMPIVDRWILIDNTMGDAKIVATDQECYDGKLFKLIMDRCNERK